MNSFEEGYKNFSEISPGITGAYMGGEYIQNIQAAINDMSNRMNNPGREITNSQISTLKGFAAEWWHEGTFNINAAVKDSASRAIAPDNNGLADINLSTLDGIKEYSLKYYKTGKDSAFQQAKSNFERYKQYVAQYKTTHNGVAPDISYEEYSGGKVASDAYYKGMERLIPSDQLLDAKTALEQKIAKLTALGRTEQADSLKETLSRLSDRVSAGEVESIPLTEVEARELATALKNEGFDPADFGLTFDNLLSAQDILKQAFKAGLTAALISTVLKVAPKICGIITRLIKEGKVDSKQFKELGFAAVTGPAEGFVSGTVASAITQVFVSNIKDMAKMGLITQAASTAIGSVSPFVIGAITAITVRTIGNACLLSMSRINQQEFADRCARDFVTTVCSVGLGIAGAAIFSAVFTPTTAIIGFMIGSFVGSIIGGFVYKGLKKCIIAFCVKSGSTFFGLVDQDYELPDDVIKSMGFDVFKYQEYQLDEFKYSGYSPELFQYKVYEPDVLNIQFLRRGVIGISKVGYVY